MMPMWGRERCVCVCVCVCECMCVGLPRCTREKMIDLSVCRACGREQRFTRRGLDDGPGLRSPEAIWDMGYFGDQLRRYRTSPSRSCVMETRLAIQAKHEADLTGRETAYNVILQREPRRTRDGETGDSEDAFRGPA